MSAEFIATRRLRAKTREGALFDIEVGIGKPVPCGDEEWKCAVSLGGLHARLVDQHGVDSWQALMLAQALARQLLEYFVEDGGQLVDPANEDASANLSAMFSGGTL